MSKKKYVAQIQPKISKADEKAISNQFRNIADNFQGSMKSAKKLGGAIATASVVMAWWTHQKKSIDNVNNSFNEYLANADRLGTIANDLQTNSGNFALADLGLSTFGLSQEDRDKLYSGVKQALAEGAIQQNGGNLLGSLFDIQAEYKSALAKKDIKKQDFIKQLTGLRGQKATEFLGGNLQEQIAKLSDNFNIQDINNAVNKGGQLEQKQAESLAMQQLKGLLQYSKVAENGIIKSQEQYAEALRQATLEQYKNYDSMIKFEIAKQKTINNLWGLIDNLVNPILAKVSGASGSAPDIIATILGAIFSSLFNGFKSKIILYIQSILSSLGLSKLIGSKGYTPTEAEKNNLQVLKNHNSMRGK